jgi:hypothetical protein
MQVDPQLMPAGLELTVPAPAATTVSATVLSVKVAATDAAALTETTQDPVPVQFAPDHPPKVEPAAAWALSVTIVPAAKLAEQVLPQLMPAGVDVTVPVPLPAGTTVMR